MSAQPGQKPTPATRRFVLIGQTASASGEFSTEDLPSSSGRLDVLLRALRAALMVSHGLRRNVVVYLVLRGSTRAPRVLRIDGSEAKFLRPDERSLALLVKKVLATPADQDAFVFRPVKPGLALAQGDLECVLRDAPSATPYVLDELGQDLRTEPLERQDLLFFIGDHTGIEPTARALLDLRGARPLSVGPLSIHSDDVVAVVSNELDRRELEPT